MKDQLTKLFIFAVGAAVGSAVTWKLLKDKYEQRTREEIESVKEVFSKKYAESKSEEETENVSEPETESSGLNDENNGREWIITGQKPDLMEYAKKLKELRYVGGGIENPDPNDPFVISPDDFGEYEGYKTESLNYYSDGILADDYDRVIDDIENTVGADALNRFGEYDDDSVYVRNNRLKTDYEILLYGRAYTDVVDLLPDKDEEE